MAEIANKWYSPKQICEYFGISRDTFLKWIETKNMPAQNGRTMEIQIG